MDNSKYEFQNDMPEGVTVDSSETELCDCSWIEILDENGSEAMGKPIGNYITIETDIVGCGRNNELDEIAKTVSEYLVKIMGITVNESVLVVGIGNRNIIADSLGVRAVDKVWATRHVADEAGDLLGKAIPNVSVISPGVMGVTGISTADIVKSICDAIKPSLVIVVDALVARKTSRLYSTIQISDTGLTPSGGLLGNVKQRIDSEFIGLPVISIGVPMVVSAATIITDFMGYVIEEHGDNEEVEVNATMLEDVNEYANELFSSSSPFVATKEIDTVVHYSSYIISTAINRALFQEDWEQIPYNNY